MITTTTNNWMSAFDERSQRLICNCQVYAANDPAGLPGHQLMLVVAHMANMLTIAETTIEVLACESEAKQTEP
ncbi:MAG: hypothetical protein IAE79_02855 [Anaerolinea sp.]|nr:hypothetical protein [Anaerolinea sp.]